MKNMPLISKFKTQARRFARNSLDAYMPGFAHIYRQIREYRASLNPQMDTKFGFKFAGNSSMVDGVFEKDEIEIFIKYLNISAVCVDVGANIGFYSCLSAQLKKHVIAVEPLPQNLQILYKNLICNHFTDVEVFPLGLSQQGGIKPIYGMDTGASFISGWSGTTDKFFTIVPVTTLDTILNNRFMGLPILIKMDVEGLEYSVLQGSLFTLNLKPKPVWLLEVHLNHNFSLGLNANFMATFETFWHHGYKAFTADIHRRLISKDDVARWIQQGHVDFGSHNYIFHDVDDD